MPRTCKLDDATQARILEALRAGNSRKTAARYGGITPQTFCTWFRKGRKAKAGKFHFFHHEVLQAETHAIVRNVAIVQKAAQDDWKAACWWLARKCPKDWGRRREYDITMRGQLQHQVEGDAGEVKIGRASCREG